jgi:ornithine cyclodeaminase/alanine dehydrogenase-like protein (mu-crystallin family)
MTRETLLLSDEDVRHCISESEIVQVVHEVYRAWGEGKVVMPAKISTDLRRFGLDSAFSAMPGYLAEHNVAGLKWAAGCGDNPAHGLPYILATIILSDPRTGITLSVLDGYYISNVRTGGAAAWAAKYTANPDSRIVGLIGAGTQSRMALRALSAFFQIEEVRIVDVIPAAQDRFQAEMEKELGLKVVKAANNRAAVEGADIVCCATPAPGPVVMNSWVKRGATAIALGSYQEYDDEFILAADKIIVDSWAQCSNRGALKKVVERGLLDEKNIYGEMGALACGKKPGRHSTEERILVVPIGLGLHDIAAAKIAYCRALEKGLGVKFRFAQ